MIDPFIERLIGLLSPAEWKSLIWLMCITLAATHTIKVSWRLSSLPGASNTAVYLISAIVGFSATYFVWPSHNVPWYMVGITVGPASNIAFKIVVALLEKFLPGVTASINFDRRKESTEQVAGTGERKGDK